MPVIQENEKSNFKEQQLFQKVSDPLSLRPVLKSRLPRSCCMINQLQVYDEFKDNLNAYSFEESGDGDDGEIHAETGDSKKLWILFTYNREDWNCVITISSPTPDSEDIPSQVKHALEFSKIIDWDAPFVLLNLDLNLSDFLQKLNIRTIGNVIKIFPCYLFYMDPEDASKLELTPPSDPSVTVGSCDPVKVTEFFQNHWNFFRQGSNEFFLKSIPHCVSAAVYLADGEIACAAFLAPYGNICSLITRKDLRRKGYASLVMRYLFRELGRRGLHPVWETYLTNHAGLPLHMTFKPQILAKVDYICHNTL